MVFQNLYFPKKRTNPFEMKVALLCLLISLPVVSGVTVHHHALPLQLLSSLADEVEALKEW